MEKSTHAHAWEAIVQKARERAAQKGETQTSIADLLGVHKATFGRWLRGERGGKKASIDDMLFYMESVKKRIVTKTEMNQWSS